MNSKNEILIRFSKYGKWIPMNDDVEFSNKTHLISYILEKYSSKKFIAMRFDGAESTIKRILN